MRAKVVLVGPSNAGKTSIINQYVYGEFSTQCMASTQPAFCQKSIIIDQKPVKLEIWDTAGQEQYHSLSPLFYRDADIGIVTFDVTDEDSFKVAENWINELILSRGESIVIGLAANKIDLNPRKVSFSQAQQFALERSITAIETSACTGENVELLFQKMVEVAISKGHFKWKQEGNSQSKSNCFC